MLHQMQVRAVGTLPLVFLLLTSVFASCCRAGDLTSVSAFVSRVHAVAARDTFIGM